MPTPAPDLLRRRRWFIAAIRFVNRQRLWRRSAGVDFDCSGARRDLGMRFAIAREVAIAALIAATMHRRPGLFGLHHGFLGAAARSVSHCATPFPFLSIGVAKSIIALSNCVFNRGLNPAAIIRLAFMFINLMM